MRAGRPRPVAGQVEHDRQGGEPGGADAAPARCGSPTVVGRLAHGHSKRSTRSDHGDAVRVAQLPDLGQALGGDLGRADDDLGDRRRAQHLLEAIAAAGDAEPVDVGPRQRRVVVEERDRFAAEGAVRSDLAQHHQAGVAGAVDDDRLASGRPRPQAFGHQTRRDAAAAEEQEQQDAVDHEQRPRVAVEAEDCEDASTESTPPRTTACASRTIVSRLVCRHSPW